MLTQDKLKSSAVESHFCHVLAIKSQGISTHSSEGTVHKITGPSSSKVSGL